MQFGQEYTGRHELLLTVPLTQDDVQELIATRGTLGMILFGDGMYKEEGSVLSMLPFGSYKGDPQYKNNQLFK